MRSPRGTDMRRTSFFAIIWILWKERNARYFIGKRADGATLAEFLKFTVASWLFVYPNFNHFSIDQIMHDWREHHSLDGSLMCLVVMQFLWGLRFVWLVCRLYVVVLGSFFRG